MYTEVQYCALVLWQVESNWPTAVGRGLSHFSVRKTWDCPPPCARQTGTPSPGRFLELSVKAQIRAFLEHALNRIALYSRVAAHQRVTKEVIFGTPNRVSRRRSKTPKLKGKAEGDSPIFCGAKKLGQSPAGVFSRPGPVKCAKNQTFNFGTLDCGRDRSPAGRFRGKIALRKAGRLGGRIIALPNLTSPAVLHGSQTQGCQLL